LQAKERIAERYAAAQLQQEHRGLSLAAEYGLLRLRLQFASSPGTPGLPPAVCLFRGGDPSKLLPGKPARSKAEARLRSLEGQLFGGQQPSLDDSQFAATAAAAAVHEIQRLQAVITSLAQQVRWAGW